MAVINTAIMWFRDKAIELPALSIVSVIAKTALKAADEVIQNKLLSSIDEKQTKKLEELLINKEGQTSLDRFKAEAEAPSSVTMKVELQRLRELREYLFNMPALQTVSRRKVEYYAEQGSRYHASELRQLKVSRRQTILLCYVKVNHARRLDRAVEIFMSIWTNAKAAATRHAHAYRDARAACQEKHEAVLGNLLDFICDTTSSDKDMARKIRLYKSHEAYENLRKEIKEGISWKECYHQKVKDHYTTLRRFLPDWYGLIPLVTTTADDSLLQGIRFLQEHACPNETTLPAAGVPIDFLSSDWERRAIVRHMWDKRITIVHKAPYELGVVDGIYSSLKNGTLAIEGARRYAPMTEHLINREDFLTHYADHVKNLNYPESASDYYQSLREEMSNLLEEFDKDYKRVNEQFRVNRNGKLSYLRGPSDKPPKRIKTLSEKLQGFIMPVSIIDIFLDCHSITNLLNDFQPLNKRQNITEEERIHGLLATLYAYGCNSGPTQAAQATGLRKQAILYFRRHYMGIKQLMDAASRLVDAYLKTSMSEILKDPGIFMTDSMHFPTLKDSLTGRYYFRNPGDKNILLYQHVTTGCICFFTKALLCSVSEGIHMLDGPVKQKSQFKASINVCDSGGRSDLVVGLAHLIHIEIWTRLSSRQGLKLWRASKDMNYSHINDAITGTINWALIDKGWKDMMWVITSVASGKAEPSLITEHLNSRAKHPATLGFIELGKVKRTIYMLHYGMDMGLRHPVTRYIARRETWNDFSRNVFHASGGVVREKSQEGQDELFWFLTEVHPTEIV
ncbi:MAG: transposase [Planctomycetes bacterium]|nr:transposase [Planctomycetota bacterium]